MSIWLQRAVEYGETRKIKQIFDEIDSFEDAKVRSEVYFD
jgi:hypothetical protein